MGDFINTAFLDNSKDLWGREPIIYIYLVAEIMNLCGAYGLNWFSGKEALILSLVGLLITFVARGHVSPAQAKSVNAGTTQLPLIQK